MSKYILAPSQLLILLVTLLFIKPYVRCSVELNDEFIVDTACTNNKRHDIEHHLATKTPYRVVANLNDTPLNYLDCQPQRIWAVVRHGTRNPSEKVIRQAHDRLEHIKRRILKNPHTKLCTEELARLRFWSFNVTASEEKYLVAEGEDELIELAERMQKRFPDLLPPYYDPHLYRFKYTATQRTERSAQSFAIGLFGRESLPSVMYAEPMDKDPILRVCIVH